MNKIVNVNLGGYPFTIDENAYRELNKYLSAIERHFSRSEGCEEIMDDIEARMAELFNEQLNGKAIVSLRELENVIKIMGRPEDFGAETVDDFDFEENQTRQTGSSKIKTGKRLYRDADDGVIAGVCSGIAAYFGISDPLWVRLTFLALVFLGGLSFLVYPILWALVPEAKTSADKLKMRGEPTTIQNIAKTVEEEINNLSDRINEISKDLTSKKKTMKKKDEVFH